MRTRIAENIGLGVQTNGGSNGEYIHIWMIRSKSTQVYTVTKNRYSVTFKQNCLIYNAMWFKFKNEKDY